MSAFEKLRIKNFQSIKNAEMHLGRVNVVCGKSNIGKSALCRAVRTLLRNSFDLSFPRAGETKLEVSIEEGGTEAAFMRNGRTSSYTFNGRRLDKAGKTVPENVRDFFNTPYANIGGDAKAKEIELDLNVQNQFDSPFLLSASGFDNARIFGQLTDIETAVTAQALIAKDIKTLKSKVETETEKQKELKNWINENNKIPELSCKLEDLRELIKQHEQREQRMLHIEALRQSLEHAQTEYKRLESLAAKADELNIPDTEHIKALEHLYGRIGSFTETESAYKAVLDLLIRAENCLETNTYVSETFEGVLKAVHLTDAYKHAEDKLKRLMAILSESEYVLAISEQCAAIRGILARLAGVKEASSELNEMYRDLAEREDAIRSELEDNAVCPVTGKPVTKECFIC